jgi:hypothetical protein
MNSSRKRGRPSGRTIADYLSEDPKSNWMVYGFVKAQMTAGQGKEAAIVAAEEKFELDRRTIQRKIKTFFDEEPAMREEIKKMKSLGAAVAHATNLDLASASAGTARLHALLSRLDVFYTKGEMRQIRNLTMPLASKLADEREELERFRRRVYHKPIRKSAAVKSRR